MVRRKMTQGAHGGVRMGAALGATAALSAGLLLANVWTFECRAPDGGLRWLERVPNLVTNEGLDDVLGKYLKGSGYTAAWYVGLKGSGAAAAGDTLASHAGWSEISDYAYGSPSTRPPLTLGSVSSQSVDNSASPASFAINGTATVAGGFIASVNTGTSGVLYAVADFSSSRDVENGDTLNVTATLTAASA